MFTFIGLGHQSVALNLVVALVSLPFFAKSTAVNTSDVSMSPRKKRAAAKYLSSSPLKSGVLYSCFIFVCIKRFLTHKKKKHTHTDSSITRWYQKKLFLPQKLNRIVKLLKSKAWDARLVGVISFLLILPVLATKGDNAPMQKCSLFVFVFITMFLYYKT